MLFDLSFLKPHLIFAFLKIDVPLSQISELHKPSLQPPNITKYGPAYDIRQNFSHEILEGLEENPRRMDLLSVISNRS